MDFRPFLSVTTNVLACITSPSNVFYQSLKLNVLCYIGRLASLATQLGVSQATSPLYNLSREVTGMSSSLGGEVSDDYSHLTEASAR